MINEIVNSKQWDDIKKDFSINCEMTVTIETGEKFTQCFVMDEFATKNFEKKVEQAQRTIAMALAHRDDLK